MDTTPRIHWRCGACDFSFCLASAVQLAHIDKLRYCRDHGKNYTTLQERKYRSAIFANNMKRILAHNAGGHSWKAG